VSGVGVYLKCFTGLGCCNLTAVMPHMDVIREKTFSIYTSLNCTMLLFLFQVMYDVIYLVHISNCQYKKYIQYFGWET
jgi:hypothetical protein